MKHQPALVTRSALFAAIGLLTATAVSLADVCVLFEDDADWLLAHQDRGFEGTITLDRDRPYTGEACIRVTPAQGFVTGWHLPIREAPKAGEYRYLTLAFEKRGGEHLVVHFGGGAQHVINNTHAGLPNWWPSVELLRDIPADWRSFEGEEALDLYQLFGGFDLCYLSFAPLDGECAWFDHVALTSTLQEARSLLDPAALAKHPAVQLRARLRDLESAATALPAGWSVAKRARDDLQQAQTELARASAHLTHAKVVGDNATQQAHRHLVQCRKLLDGPVTRDLAAWRLASAWPPDADPPYGVGIASTAERVFEDEPFQGALATGVTVELARNEYEGFQLVVQAFERPLADVTVQASLVRERNEARAGGERPELEVWPVGCIPTAPSMAPVSPAGKTRWPDPLLPNGPVLVPAGEARMWFVTAHAATDCKAGEYLAKVVVQPANAPPFSLRPTIRVWDFTLPNQTHLKTAFSLTECAIEAFYGLPEGMSQEMRRQYYAFCLTHRLNPSNLYGSNDGSFSTRHRGAPVTEIPIEHMVTPRDEDLEWCVDRGMALFNVTVGCTNWMDRDTFLRRLRDFLSRYPAVLRQRGLLDKAYIYCFDEPRPHSDEDYQSMRQMLELVHAAAPELPRAATHPPDPKLYGYIDIWIPLISHYDHNLAQERRAAGEEVWWYVCNVPNHPFPNFAIVEAPPIDGRILPWLAWKYGVEGLLYHNLNWWFVQVGFDAMAAFRGEGPRMWTPVPEGLRWPRVPWCPQATPGYNGDGMLMYPGPNGRPLSSVRLENIRDGLEDYEYLWLLRERIAQRDRTGGTVPQQVRALLDVPGAVAEDLTHYSRDPAGILARRRAVAQAILTLGG